jgi:hypothetical protein
MSERTGDHPSPALRVVDDANKSEHNRKSRPRQIAHDKADKPATEKPLLPLDVLMDNMRYWHRFAIELSERVEAMVVNADDDEQRREACELIKDMMNARTNSQRCAVDAAAYHHAKQSPVDTPPPSDGTLPDLMVNFLDPDRPIDANEAARVYQRIMRGI